MKAKLPLIIVIIVVIALVVVAIVIGTPKKEGEEGTQGEAVKSFKDIEIAKEIYGFSAEIKEINDKTLTLESYVPLADEKAEPVKGIVKAKITDNTKIFKLIFPKETTKNTEPVQPQEIEMKFEDLKVGDKINIGATNNVSENIKNGTEFEINDIFYIVLE